MTPTRDIASGTRPLLLLSPGSPAAASARRSLLAEADRRGVETLTIAGPSRTRAVDGAAAKLCSDSLAVCGEPGLQAIVAAVAVGRGLPFGCIPAGPDDLLAREVSLAPEDAQRSLALFLRPGERAVDVAEVNGITFLSYVALGLTVRPISEHAAGSQAAGSRAAVGASVRREGPSGLGPRPAGAPGAAPALLVTNNPFPLTDEGIGARPRMDAGVLGVLVLYPESAPRCDHSPRRLRQWTAPTLELPLESPVEADIDGSHTMLEPPLRFRIVPRGLRMRIPSSPNTGPL
jgi:diacylglycerol kinase family enzyme